MFMPHSLLIKAEPLTSDNKNKGGIYLIYNEVKDKIYIGSTNNFSRRWKEHLCQLNKNSHPNTPLQRAYLKYGLTNIKLWILEIIPDRNLLFETEQKYLDLYQPYKKEIGYNISPVAGCGYPSLEKVKEMVKKRAYWWVVFKPDGSAFLIQNLKEFCRQNKSVVGILSSKLETQFIRNTKGYYCRKATEQEVEEQTILDFHTPSFLKKARKDSSTNVCNILKRSNNRYTIKFNKTFLGSFDSISKAQCFLQKLQSSSKSEQEIIIKALKASLKRRQTFGRKGYKYFVIFSYLGDCILTNELNKFCKERELNSLGLYSVKNKPNKTYLGYWIREAQEEEIKSNKVLNFNCPDLKDPTIKNKLGYSGVYKRGNRYRAKLNTNGKTIHLGTFNTPEEAHQAYLKAKE
jgi:group I intron endonuclease